MVSFPPCKINLGLHILSRRTDGFHNLETCFYPVPWVDILEIIPATETEFSCSGNSIPGELKNNLCLRAYHLLKERYNLPPVKIHLHKVIPTGAGLGGGSSDGAHALKLLNTIFELKLSAGELTVYATLLGSDCAFFIQDEPRIGTGRGEVLSGVKVNLRNKFLVIAKPDIHVSTAEAFAHVTPQPIRSALQVALEKEPIERWKDFIVNDFEDSVGQKYPVIPAIKKRLYDAGAVYASMSGSGAAVFGIFNTPIDFNMPDVPTSWTGSLA